MTSVTRPVAHTRDNEKVIAQAYLTRLLAPICRTRWWNFMQRTLESKLLTLLFTASIIVRDIRKYKLFFPLNSSWYLPKLSLMCILSSTRNLGVVFERLAILLLLVFENLEDLSCLFNFLSIWLFLNCVMMSLIKHTVCISVKLCHL